MVDAAIIKLFEAIAEFAGEDVVGRPQRDVLVELGLARRRPTDPSA